MSAPAKPAVGRAGCKTWCGGPRAGVPEKERGGSFPDSLGNTWSDNSVRWCRPACKHARVPPLAPVGDVAGLCGIMLPSGHRCRLNDGHANACSMWRAESTKPAVCYAIIDDVRRCQLNYRHDGPHFTAEVEPAKPAPVVQAPVCLGCRKSPCNHGYVMCEQGVGSWGRRETMGAVMLHETKLPERLTPARLAHSMGIESDEWENA